MQVYLCQYDIAWEDRRANHEQVERLFASVEFAPDSMVVLPEMFDTGFSMNTAYTAGASASTSLLFLRNLAKEYGVYILAGVVSSAVGEGAVNQAVIVSPAGLEMSRYTKIHSFTYAGEQLHYRQGERVDVVRCGEIGVCPLICYDLRFPETFRAGLSLGAEMYVVIANFPAARHDHWRSLLVARAIENQCYVVGVNRTGCDVNVQYSGGSMVVGPGGEVLVEAGVDGGIYSAAVDAKVVRSCREKFPVLDDIVGDEVR